MKNYELLYIVSNQYTESEATGIKNKVSELITKKGGVIGYEENLGKRKLAYPINHVSAGYYFLQEFELENGEVVKEINNDLRLDKEILRAQIISKKKISAEEIERNKKMVAEEAQNKELEETETEKPKQAPIEVNEADESAESTEEPETKIEKPKKEMKNLDEKLEEILTSEDLI